MGILHSGILNSQPDTRIAAICEKDKLLTRLAKNILPKTIEFYNDHIKMVESTNLDAVVITTPIDTHVPLVVDLVEANSNLSLFVEKPLASSATQAQLASNAARKLHGIHMVGYQKRFSPVFRRAREYLSNGDLGELMFFRAYAFSSDVLREASAWRFKKGGGVLLDLAPHVLDLLLWFFGMPDSITGTRTRFYSRQVDDYIHSVLSFNSGLRGHLDACWSVRNFRLPEFSIEVFGKKGSLRVTDDLLNVDVEKDDGTRIRRAYYKQSFDTSVSFLLADPEYTKQDESFLRSIQERSLPMSNFFESARVNMILDRIGEGSREITR
jgi:predicted dehydrogenase